MLRRIVLAGIVGLLVNPSLADEMKPSAMGVFHDGVHTGKGAASIVETAPGVRVLRLTSFETTRGPDLKVWLVKAPGIRTAADVKGSDSLSLGALASPSGDQEYAIPADAKIEDYNSVAIWCESFSVLFAAADLTR